MTAVARPRPGGRRRRHLVVARPGQTPGLQYLEIPPLDAPGTIRRNVRPAISAIPAPPPFSWADNPRIFTRPLRYKASTTYRAAGTDRTQTGAPRPVFKAKARTAIVTRQAGNKPAGPTVRNRLASFGSRVPPLNAPSPNAEAGA